LRRVRSPACEDYGLRSSGSSLTLNPRIRYSDLGGPEDGWWEAIVTGRDGDMLTLKWRDYPKYKRFPRHRLSVALLSPNGQ
jgi:hypothetical protein